MKRAMVLVIWTAGVSVAAAPVAPPASLTLPVKSPSDIRQDFLTLIDHPRVPLAPEVKETATSGGLTEYRLTYTAQKSQPIPGILIKSSHSTGKRPVVIALHGTGGKKEDERALLRDLATRGFIGVAIDGPYHGERAKVTAPASVPALAPLPAGINAYETAILRAWQMPEPHEHPFFFDTVWDVMRLVDYLETRDDVDATRIGLYGVSKGGIETYLTAAVDPRIAVAVPCISVESFRWANENDSWESRIGTVQKAFDAAARESAVAKPDGVFVAQFYSHVAPGIDGEFDGPSIVPLIAPRPLLAINGDKDPRTPGPGLKLATDAIAAAYHKAGADEHVLLRLQANTAHQVRPESQTAAEEWFVRWLKP